MFVLEQALVVVALVGACGLAYRLMTGPRSSHSGGDCGCEPADDAPRLTQISRRPKA